MSITFDFEDKKSDKDDRIAILCAWIKRIRQACELDRKKPYQELELEFSIRPDPPFNFLQGRAADIGHPLFQAWRQMLGDTVKTQMDLQPSLGDSFEFYNKTFYCDYFYLDGSVRQRVFEETNHLPVWTRKQPVDLALVDLLDNNKWTWTDQKLLIKLQLKHEKPLDTQLPKDVYPSWARQKTTHRFRFPEHPMCWIDLSEVTNVKFSKHGDRISEEGPPVYEMEVEVSSEVFRPKSLDIKYVKYKEELYDEETWIQCGNLVNQLHELLGVTVK